MLSKHWLFAAGGALLVLLILDWETSGPIVPRVVSALSAFEAFIEHHEKFRITLLTGGVVYFTYTLWKATVGLLRAAESQKKDMEQSLTIALESAQAAKSAAEAANAQLKISDKRSAGLAQSLGWITGITQSYEAPDVCASHCHGRDTHLG